MRKIKLLGVAVCLCLTTALMAQDPVKVDPKHYTVVSENDRVRVLKIHYGPHEKSVMHSHPDLVAVFLSDGKGKFTFPDGKTQDFAVSKGQSMWSDAGIHLPENTGDSSLDGILLELKGKAAAKSAVKKPGAKPASPGAKK